MHIHSASQSVARTIRSLLPALTAFGVLALSAATTQAQVVGGADFRFEDHQTTLGNVSQQIIAGHSNNFRAATVAKAIITNSSSGVRSVECRLAHSGSLDIAAVTLQPNSHVTVSMQVAKDATSATGGVRPAMSCRVTSAAISSVTVQWSKMTTWFLAGLISGPG